MNLNPNKLLNVYAKQYFDKIYVPIYDSTTGQMGCYRNLHNKCIDRLKVAEGNKIFCAGVGTGNEIALLIKTKNISITGIDYSEPSIMIAKDKYKGYKNIKFELGDVHNIQFDSNLFDRVLCACVMGFVKNQEQATLEIVRVLKSGGRLVVTYPSNKRPRVTFYLLKDSLTDVKRLYKFFRFFIAFLPLVFIRKVQPLPLEKIKELLSDNGIVDIQVDIDLIYGDYIISGVKK